MWRYQKPGFEALLVAALQRQQQCSQHCNILLKAKGLLVPAHSCVLSAISPLMSSALSTTPLLPVGKSHQMEFQSLEPCTLHHMVELLYSGQMTGEGEREKQEAISAAARLGIDGLVEVTETDSNQRPQVEGNHCTDVGVQTEPSESESIRWRREVRDGATFLWKENVSPGGQDMWTQTEEPTVNAASPRPPPLSPHPPTSFQTIDMNSFQSLGQTNSQLVPTEIVPISIVYSENQWTHGSSAPSVPVAVVGSDGASVSVPSSLLLSPSQVIMCGAEPEAGWSAPEMAAAVTAEGAQDEHFEQFQGNIPGFINHFLNPESQEGCGMRPANKKRGAAAGGARRAQGASRGRGQGALTQTVDVQEVSSVGRLQKLFLHRFARRLRRSGQGGGAAGRRLQLKTRELLNSRAAQQTKRVRTKVWELNQTGDLHLRRKGSGGGSGQQGKKNTTPQGNQTCSSARKKKLPSPASSPPPPACTYDLDTLTSPGAACLQPAAPSFAPPAASLLHTCPLPPPAPLPDGDQPHHIDHLLEEVMMGLDIIPSGSDASRPPPASSSHCAVASLAQSPQQSPAADLHRSPGDAGGAAGPHPAGGDVSVLQQVCEGEMNKLLDQFLQSFEQYVNGEEPAAAGKSCAEAAQSHSKYKRALSPRLQNAGAPQQVGHPQAKKGKRGDAPPSSSRPHTAVRPQCIKKLSKKRQRQYPLEKKKVKLKMAVTIHDVNVAVSGQVEKQLQQIPVVKLKRSRLPPDITTKTEEMTEVAALAVKNSDRFFPEENLLSFPDRKSYPIRSRLNRMSLIASSSVIDKPLKVMKKPDGKKCPISAGQTHHRQGRLKKNSFNTNEELKVIKGTHVYKSAVQPQKEAEKPRKRQKKRRKTNQNVTATKMVFMEHRENETRPKTESGEFVSQSASEKVTGGNAGPLGDRSQEAPRSASIKMSQRETESAVEVNAPGCTEFTDREEKDWRLSVRTKVSASPEQDEDIDVIGGSSPAPDPVTICWSESEEEEEEEEEGDVDIVGEK